MTQPAHPLTSSATQLASVLRQTSNMQLLGPVSFSVFALALACVVRAQESTTAYPDTTTYFDVTSSDLTTRVSEDVTTLDSTEAGFGSAETENTDGSDQSTTVEVEQQSTTESTIGEEATDVTSGDDGTGTSTPAVEEGAKKDHLPDVAETSTAAAPERKPVKEPPFIKKYWPLLCLATRCDKRGSAPVPVIPNPDAPEVRSDLEESRSANSGEAEDDSSSAEVAEVPKAGGDSRSSAEVLKALEEQMLRDQPATDSTQTTDKSAETTRFTSDESSEENSDVTDKPETTTAKSSSEEEEKDKKDDDDDEDDDDHDDDDDKKKDDD